jgi:hypothetical protein
VDVKTLTYGGTQPVQVRVRRRGGWVHFSDDGAAVTAAGAPAGWFPVAEGVVAELDLNVNRRGVVFVSSPERRGREWLDSLERRVGDASLAVYEALLELDEP